MNIKVAIALFRGLMAGMRMITEAIYRTANPYTHDDTNYWFTVETEQAIRQAESDGEKAPDAPDTEERSCTHDGIY